MRCAAVALVVLLFAVAYYLSEHEKVPPQSPARPVSCVHNEFEALQRECCSAQSTLLEGLDQGTPQIQHAVSTELTKRAFFLRFLDLAERYADDPLCPKIVCFALGQCGGAHLSPEDHQRMASLLTKHEGLRDVLHVVVD